MLGEITYQFPKFQRLYIYIYIYIHKILTRLSSGNRLRGLWLQIFITYSRRSGFSNELETSLKIAQNFLIVHELNKATFEYLYIFSFDYLLRQVIQMLVKLFFRISRRVPFWKFWGNVPLSRYFSSNVSDFDMHLGRTSLWESWIFLPNHPGAFYILKSVI